VNIKITPATFVDISARHRKFFVKVYVAVRQLNIHFIAKLNMLGNIP